MRRIERQLVATDTVHSISIDRECTLLVDPDSASFQNLSLTAHEGSCKGGRSCKSAMGKVMKASSRVDEATAAPSDKAPT